MQPLERLAAQRKVQQQVKMKGLSMSRDGLEILVDYIERNDVTPQAAVDLLLAGLDQLSVDAQVISGKVVADVLKKAGPTRQTRQAEAAALLAESSQEGSGGALEASIRVLDAFEMPRIEFDPHRKQYFRSKLKPTIAGSAQSKAALYRSRLQQLLARTRRSRQFAKQDLFSSKPKDEEEDETPELVTVQGLVGQAGHRRWVLGLISQLEDGKFFLEDLTSSIPLDLTHVKPSLGLFTENSVVLVLGSLLPTGVFKAYEFAFPPFEKREESMAVTEGLDFLGESFLDTHTYAVLKEHEQDPSVAGHLFVFISDIWLDKPQAVSKLAQVLSAYDALPIVPSLFVLIGNFSSRPFSLATTDMQSLRASLRSLGSLIASNQNLKANSKFVIVPGPGDPALPRPGIPKSFSEELQEALPGCILASNPCRIQFLSQEIVVFREELSWQMQRACVVPPALDLDPEPFHHVAATLAHQAHLCPLPISREPILWEFDHALSLFPLPNVVVLADNSEENQYEYADMSCVKLGPFSLDGTFMAYRPSSQTVEPCKI